MAYENKTENDTDENQWTKPKGIFGKSGQVKEATARPRNADLKETPYDDNPLPMMDKMMKGMDEEDKEDDEPCGMGRFIKIIIKLPMK